jgi:voltage-dependent potassium channel beta subunit
MSVTMPYRKLGDSGLSVSLLSYGSWVTFGKQMDVNPVVDCIKYAFEKGVNFFDNAEVYANGQSESLMGQAFQRLGLSRNEYVLTSKFFWGIENRVNFKNTLNRKYMSQAIEGSLKRLGTEFIDVIYCHRYDPETPIHEICMTMDQAIRRGQALYWGTSEWPASALEAAYDFCVQNSLHRPIVEQPQYNLLFRDKVENEFAPLYKKMKLGLTIWSPLASGVLTGKYLNGIPENTRAAMPSLSFVREQAEDKKLRERVLKLQKISQDTGIGMAHLSIAWCAHNPNVSTVILGASRLEQLQENMKSLEFFTQTQGLMSELATV